MTKKEYMILREEAEKYGISTLEGEMENLYMEAYDTLIDYPLEVVGTGRKVVSILTALHDELVRVREKLLITEGALEICQGELELAIQKQRKSTDAEQK